MAKRHLGRELWERLSSFVESDDGLQTTELGSWTKEKLFYVGCYLAQVTTAMHGNKKFPNGIVFVDLFCGNGVCVPKDHPNYRFPGSSLLAAGCEKPFTKLVLVDENEANLTALNSRISQLTTNSEVITREGNCNNIITDISREIPDRSLGIAFFDPWSLGAHYETIRMLTSRRQMDLIILYPDAMELRNIDEYYYPGKSDKFDLAMGDDGAWRSMWDTVREKSAADRRTALAEYYFARLNELSYKYVDARDIKSVKGPMYKLVYASKHELGLKFWDIALKEELSGQRRFI